MRKRITVYILPIVILLLLLDVSAKAEDIPVKDILSRYSTTGDSSGIQKALGTINDEFSSYTGKEYGESIDACITRSTKDHSPLIKEFHTIKAKWFRYNNDIARSAAEYSKVYDLLSKSNREDEAVWILIEIGNLFFATENYTDATTFYKRAEVLSEKLKDNYALSVINLNLGLIETSTENYGLAVSYLKKCIKLREGTKENAFISHTYIKLSEIYARLNKTDSVLFYIKASEQLYYAEGTHVGVLENMPSLINMAYYKYFSEAGNTRIAKVYLLKAREYIRSRNLESRLYDSFITEAHYELENGNAQVVIDSLGFILPQLKRSSYTEFYMTALHLLAKASHDAGSYKASKQYYEQFIATEAEADSRMSIDNGSVAGIIGKVTKPKLESAADVVQEKKDPQLSILYILLAVSVSAIIFMRLKLSEKSRRNSELKRELDRQYSDFTDKLKKRTNDIN